MILGAAKAGGEVEFAGKAAVDRKSEERSRAKPQRRKVRKFPSRLYAGERLVPSLIAPRACRSYDGSALQ
jgi:hypothetical protein